MPSCKDCKEAYRKGHWCNARRKNIAPYHTACELFLMSDEAKERIKSVKIPEIIDFEANTLYIIARAMEILIYDIDKRLNYHRRRFDEDKRKLFAHITDYIDKLKEKFDKLEKDYTYNLNTTDYDTMNRDANELVRLILLYGDKCSCDRENSEDLFQLLKFMSGKNVVKDDDLKRFYLKEK